MSDTVPPSNPFAPTFSALPDVLPIFPLTGVLLLPGGRLPLNVFEPRYLAMVSDAHLDQPQSPKTALGSFDLRQAAERDRRAVR